MIQSPHAVSFFWNFLRSFDAMFVLSTLVCKLLAWAQIRDRRQIVRDGSVIYREVHRNIWPRQFFELACKPRRPSREAEHP
jgi:hypothetical protein